MKIKRVISAILLMAVLLSALSACKPTSDAPHESETPAQSETEAPDLGESGELGGADLPTEPEIE